MRNTFNILHTGLFLVLLGYHCGITNGQTGSFTTENNVTRAPTTANSARGAPISENSVTEATPTANIATQATSTKNTPIDSKTNASTKHNATEPTNTENSFKEATTVVIHAAEAITSETSSTEVPKTTHKEIQKNASRTCDSPEACVFAEIFKGYNRLTRPVNDPNKSIDVEIQMVFNGLMDIEEKDEYMRSVGFFRAFWYDDLLRWNPDDFSGVDMIIVPAETIWIPDIGIANSVSSFYEITYKRDFHLQVHFDGKIRWSFGGVLTTSCDIDLTLYPFDKQHCAVEVESWQYEKAKVKLSLINGTAINLDTAEPDPQWILDGAEGETFLKYDDRFSAVKFTLHWSRKPLYFYINIIVPTAFMGLITLGVFWLPAECGEKMSLGITVVLAFSVFQIVIMEITPVSSDAVPKITELVLTVMSLATASLLSSMVVSYLRECEYPPPKWIRKVFLYYIPKVTRLSFYHTYKHEFIDERSSPKHVKGKAIKDKDVYKKYFVEDGHAKQQTSPTRSVSSLANDTDKNQVTRNNCTMKVVVQLDAGEMARQTQHQRDEKYKGITLQNIGLVEEQKPNGHSKESVLSEDSQTVIVSKDKAKHRLDQQNGAVPSKRRSYTPKNHQRNTEKDTAGGEFVVKDIRQILSILEGMGERVVKEEDAASIREEWKYIGRSFDMLIFWLCVMGFLMFIIYISVATMRGKAT